MGQSESVVDPHLWNNFLGFQDNINARNMISTMAEMRKCQQIQHSPYTIVSQSRQSSAFKVYNIVKIHSLRKGCIFIYLRSKKYFVCVNYFLCSTISSWSHYENTN